MALLFCGCCIWDLMSRTLWKCDVFLLAKSCSRKMLSWKMRLSNPARENLFQPSPLVSSLFFVFHSFTLGLRHGALLPRGRWRLRNGKQDNRLQNHCKGDGRRCSFLKCVCVTTITRKALSRLVVTAQRITDKMTSNLHRAFIFDYSTGGGI